MPTRFTFIRHGQTDWNIAGKWQGHAWIGLNDEGHRQAQFVAGAFAASDATLIYTSDLPRARQTAEYIAAKLDCPLIADARLREIDVGDWQGLTGEEVERWDGERYAVVRAGGYTMRRPGGESQEDVGLRVLALINEVVTTHVDQHILLVSHGGTIRNTLSALDLLDPSHGHVGNTSRTSLLHHAADARWELDTFNILTHLPATAPTRPVEG